MAIEFLKKHKKEIFATAVILLAVFVIASSLGIAGVITVPAFFAAIGFGLASTTGGNIAIGASVVAATSVGAPIAAKKLGNCSSAQINQRLNLVEEAPTSNNNHEDAPASDGSSNFFYDPEEYGEENNSEEDDNDLYPSGSFSRLSS